jgi:beta-N-acetylhexosaminidase
MQAEGVAACAKHFPGHGDTVQDSHHDMPVIQHGRDRLLRVEIAPFREAVGSGVASVIVGHLMVPALQSKDETEQGIPASMSKSVVDILKQDLGFQGAVLIDDIEMGAVTKNFSLKEAVTQSLQAGIDLFLVCHTEESQVKVIDAIFDAVKSGAVSPERFQDALARVRHLVGKYAAPALPENSVKLNIVGSKAHRQVIKSILENAARRDQ